MFATHSDLRYTFSMPTRKMWYIIAGFIFLIIFPYILGILLHSPDLVFMGFLQNPGDGYSYLAKMRQAFDGQWLFTLPFTAEPGSGRLLFIYYYILGYLAKAFALPLIVVYHSARVINGFLFAVVSAIAITRIFKNDDSHREWMLFVLLLGSGAGWLIIGAQPPPSDLWVAEAYPFLAAYTNPHFPLALAILVATIAIWLADQFRWKYLWLAFGGFFLSWLLPFGAVILLIIFAIDTVKNAVQERKLNLNAYLIYSLAALPYLLYSLWAIQSQPQLMIWNRQNVTSSAPFWQLIISFSPALIFAAFSFFSLETYQRQEMRISLLWVWVALVICILPISLQRRFLVGLYIPLTLLAVYTITKIRNIRIKRYAQIGYLILSLPTNIIILVLALYGISTQSSDLYQSRSKLEAIQWLDQNTNSTDVVFASVKDGSILPGLAGVRVLYGHPYETPDADDMKALVSNCMQNIDTDLCKNFLLQNKVKYIFLSEPGIINNEGSTTFPGEILYQNEQARVYAYKP